MSAVSVALPRAVSRTRAADFFFLATFFCVTFEKVHWNLAGSVGIADVMTILFLIAFVLTSRGPTPRTTGIVLVFFIAFLLVYLLGFFNLEAQNRRFNRMVEPNLWLYLWYGLANDGNVHRVERMHARQLARPMASILCVTGNAPDDR